MRSVITVTIAAAVTVAVLGALHASADRARLPAGEVSVVQLPDDADIAVYASARTAAAQSRL